MSMPAAGVGTGFLVWMLGTTAMLFGGSASSSSSSSRWFPPFPKGDDESSKTYYAPVLVVTVAWVLLHYTFLFGQSAMAFHVLGKEKRAGLISLRSIKHGGQGGKLMLMANRTVGNFMEQSVAFVPGMWLCAFFYDSFSAAVLGWLWLITRTYYPFVYNQPFPALWFSTIPGYVLIFSSYAAAVNSAIDFSFWSLGREEGAR